MNSKIIGTGSCIPSTIQKNDAFKDHVFLDQNGDSLGYDNPVIIEKFKAITGIAERRYADKAHNASDLAFFAAEKAIADAAIDPETLDYIIVAHNFGDVKYGTTQSDMLPSLASRVKALLQIENPRCIAYDLIFGCPGWVEAMIQANAFIKSGIAKRCLVIGAETLSRVVDDHDRDSMIYSDGAGAAIVQASTNTGILSHASASYTKQETGYLFFGPSYAKDKQKLEDTRYIKMFGRKIYEFACTHVPTAMQSCVDASGVAITDIKKIFIHQANEKMDEAIIKRFYRLYKQDIPKNIMPMNIHLLGNSSVATVPTLFDMVRKGQVVDQSIEKGDIVLFASVGAGMNINAFLYQY